MDGNHSIKNGKPTPGRRYWQTVEERSGDPRALAAADVEFGPAPQAGDGSELARRDFLKVLGTTFAAASVTAGCARRPVEKVIPYVQKPEQITPGAPAYYSTTCGGCQAGCGLLVKARDGRPIKIEGNPDHPYSGGGVCARGQGTVIDLYDGDRLRKPVVAGAEADQAAFDKAALAALEAFKSDGSGLAILTPSLSGPATRAAAAALVSAYPGARHVVIDEADHSAILAAHQQTHGVPAVPLLDFAKADYVLSLDADWVGTWIAPVWWNRQAAPGRRLNHEKKTLTYHVSVESTMTLTGANSDERVRILPSELRGLALALAGAVVKATGTGVSVPGSETAYSAQVEKWTKALAENKGKSLVVSGSNDVAVQAAVNVINEALGNYGKTVDANRPLGNFAGDKAASDALLADLEAGKLKGIVTFGVNPAYIGKDAARWAKALAGVGVNIAFTDRLDETASLAKLAAPLSHFLEAWGDYEVMPGLVGVQQPLVRPIFGTRSLIESMLALAGKGQDGLTFVRETWKASVHPRQEKKTSFVAFWDHSVHDGFARVLPPALAAGGPAEVAPPAAPPTVGAEAAAAAAAPAAAAAAAAPAAAEAVAAEGAAAAALPAAATEAAAPSGPATAPAGFVAADAAKALVAAESKATAGAFELVAYESVAFGSGRAANNPFLQELPDPLTKCTWDNWAAVSPRTAQELGLATGDLVKVSSGAVSVEVPVVLQPGIHDKAVAIAVGYGRKKAGRVAELAGGADIYPFLALGDVIKVDIAKTGENRALGFSQTHPSYEHRQIVRETTLEAWQKNPRSNNPVLDEKLTGKGHGQDEAKPLSVWKPHEYNGKYKWEMVIDLNACNGCSACVIACNVENNVPVVGRLEVSRKRDMHWMRIDRYYAEPASATPGPGDYDWDPVEDDWMQLAENPQVVFQPVMCQHCETAGCETVCPVLATVHTSEGLNSMAYNRCIGTRYCANNCAYKVRRFNWFQYPQGEMEGKVDYDLLSLALNPDVTIRSRGVMEKCSMCVQRIQLAKSEVLRDGRDTIIDGDVQTACQQTCPTDAITFGNINDKDSAVSQAMMDPRRFKMLEEINSRPAIGYLTKVRHEFDMMPAEDLGAAAPAHGAGHGDAGHGGNEHGGSEHGGENHGEAYPAAKKED
ncbi:MAG: TAT-variant-translocated molybdopterin oxidoreductase [Deltaproteobacteria bacterium]|nr:TAT-variant-translocated molybdopterin oxidoreductase [Deltaproteobacteria bacterium]